MVGCRATCKLKHSTQLTHKTVLWCGNFYFISFYDVAVIVIIVLHVQILLHISYNFFCALQPPITHIIARRDCFSLFIFFTQCPGTIHVYNNVYTIIAWGSIINMHTCINDLMTR